MIVADTNVIASLWVPNDMDEIAYKLLKTDADWVAPLYWRSEFRSVTTKYLRAELLSFSAIVEVIQEAEMLMKDKEFEVNSTRVLKLVSESNCSSYDCEFVALADDLDVKLATFDKKIRREFSDIALHPKEFFNE